MAAQLGHYFTLCTHLKLDYSCRTCSSANDAWRGPLQKPGRRWWGATRTEAITNHILRGTSSKGISFSGSTVEWGIFIISISKETPSGFRSTLNLKRWVQSQPSHRRRWQELSRTNTSSERPQTFSFEGCFFICFRSSVVSFSMTATVNAEG